jgi:hypothetical protein
MPFCCTPKKTRHGRRAQCASALYEYASLRRATLVFHGIFRDTFRLNEQGKVHDPSYASSEPVSSRAA